MPRPKKCRFVGDELISSSFKPMGINPDNLEKVILSLEELESLKLADYQALTHAQAAELMGVSRATFGRIVETARNKTADALLNKKILIIEGGSICRKKDGDNREICPNCPHKNRKIKCPLLNNIFEKENLSFNIL